MQKRTYGFVDVIYALIIIFHQINVNFLIYHIYILHTYIINSNVFDINYKSINFHLDIDTNSMTNNNRRFKRDINILFNIRYEESSDINRNFRYNSLFNCNKYFIHDFVTIFSRIHPLTTPFCHLRGSFLMPLLYYRKFLVGRTATSAQNQ